MRVSVITPTADQPLGMLLLERYMARQTVQPDEWVVADDGVDPARLTMGQTHLVRKREHEGGRSLASNMLAAVSYAPGDMVIVFEHDDWYAPNHIEVCVERLRRSPATGSKFQRYYNVEHRCWRRMLNVGSALCNTAFRAELVPNMIRAANRCMSDASYGLDRAFWDSVSGGDVHEIDTVVGIKGLPGRPGLGMGHRPGDGWTADPEMAQLRDWIGDDVENYR
jgi:glycosyltransferase involved in cell wall biosynthesis